MSKFRIILFLFLILNISLYSKSPVRVKDITVIQGLRENQLMGFGLVTGLQGRGDSRSFKLTQKMVSNLISNFGLSITEADVKSKNVAAVMVTAKIGAFSRRGELVDITISSIGDAKSLEGGVLLQTALKGADNNIYAVAQGRIFSGSKELKMETTASIPGGALIERDVISDFFNGDKINLVLRIPDFVTANLIREQILSINENLVVNSIDAGLIEINLTEEEKENPIDFIAKLELLTVVPDYSALVIIDKKSGVIVTGGDVVIQECAVSIPQVQVNVGRNSQRKNSIEVTSSTVGELVKLLNDTGLNSNEIISLLEAIHRVGALGAKLIIM